MKFIYYSVFVSAFLGVAFVVNNFLTYIFDLPGLFGTLAFLGFGYFDITNQDYSGVFLFFGIIQSISFLLAFFAPILISSFKCTSAIFEVPINAHFIIF